MARIGAFDGARPNALLKARVSLSILCRMHVEVIWDVVREESGRRHAAAARSFYSFGPTGDLGISVGARSVWLVMSQLRPAESYCSPSGGLFSFRICLFMRI